MALIPHPREAESAVVSKRQSGWSSRDRKAPQYALPSIERPAINYEQLKKLIASRESNVTRDESHSVFMQNYHKIFLGHETRHRALPPPGAEPLQSASAEDKSTARTDRSTGPTGVRSPAESQEPSEAESSVPAGEPLLAGTPSYDQTSHNIKDYTRLLHRQPRSEADDVLKANSTKILRRILKKLPFQRASSEIKLLYKVLRLMPQVSGMVPKDVLRELCLVAQLDVWPEDQFTVFGSMGLYMILKGSVKTQSTIHLITPATRPEEYRATFRAGTPATQTETWRTLHVGDCFGTLAKLEGRSSNTKLLSAVTAEPNCEFMRITTSDYARVIEQIKAKDQAEKLSLLQAWPAFETWTRQPKLMLANLITWQKFPPNLVLVSEGYKSPFVGFVKSGECHVLKQLEVLQTLADGTQEPRVKQVIMGKIGANEVFGELSVLLEQPITCSIITASEVHLGVIAPSELFSLDETVLRLLEQSCKPTFGDLTKEAIKEEYTRQELKREWNQYKHNAVVEAINAAGIRPGYGKWQK